jgi:hypothetical protein
MSLIAEERKPEIRSAGVKYFNTLIEELSKGCLTRSHKYVVNFFIANFFYLRLQVWRLLYLRTHSETQTHTHIRQDIAGQVLIPKQKSLHTALITQEHPCPRQDSNPQFEQAVVDTTPRPRGPKDGFSVNITHMLIIRVVDSRTDNHHIECVC